MTGQKNKYQVSDYRLLFFFIVAVFAWSTFFPALNWPDEVYKISQIGIDSNIYLEALSRLSTDYCLVGYNYMPDRSYLSNHFHVRMTSDGGCYYTIKYINCIFICVLSYLSMVILNRDKYLRSLFVLSMIWPSQIFYATGVNQQAIFSIVSIFIVVSVIGSRFIVPYIFISAFLVLVDRSFISLFVFLLLLTIMRWRPRLAVPMFIVGSVLAVVATPYIEGFGVLFSDGQTVGDISKGLEGYYDSPLVSAALLLLSFVYVGGTNSIVGVGIDYLIVLGFMAISIWKNRGNSEMISYLLSFVFSYFLIIMFVPTIQTFRYYVFTIPVFIHFLLKDGDNKKKYVYYCMAMNAIYLVQANILYG